MSQTVGRLRKALKATPSSAGEILIAIIAFTAFITFILSVYGKGSSDSNNDVPLYATLAALTWLVSSVSYTVVTIFVGNSLYLGLLTIFSLITYVGSAVGLQNFDPGNTTPTIFSFALFVHLSSGLVLMVYRAFPDDDDLLNLNET